MELFVAALALASGLGAAGQVRSEPGTLLPPGPTSVLDKRGEHDGNPWHAAMAQPENARIPDSLGAHCLN